jgi:type IV pilus secretin PilQ/predicted competence protein
MGHIGISNRERVGSSRKLARSALALLAAAAVAACAAGRSPAANPATAGSEAAPAAGQAAAPNVVRTLAMRPAGDGVAVAVAADQPLVWTSFRDPEGRLIVELADSVPGAALSGLSSATGLVSSLAVEREQRAGRPLTRLVIATRQEVEHAVAGDGDALVVQLTPLASAGTMALAYEPLPADEPEPAEDAAAFEVAAAAADDADDADDEAEVPRLSELIADEPIVRPAPVAVPAPAAVDHLAEAGTADRPFVAPPLTGPAASQLVGVEARTTDAGAVIHVHGDGQFAYSTFALANPHRFVIDLDGVENRSDRPTVAVNRGSLERVRVAQFRGSPEPVARVVFDLASPTVPRIERTAEALVVSFNGVHPPAATPRPAVVAPAVVAPAAVAPAAARAPAPTAAPQPPQEPVEEPLVDGEERLEDRVPVRTVTEPAVPPATVQRPIEPPPARVAPPVPPAAARAAASDLELSSPGSIEIDTPTTPVEAFAARPLDGGERQFVGELYSFSLRDADLVETLRSFASMSELNMVIQPGVSGTVTMELNDVPWDQAFEQVLKINGLSYEVEGNIMRIAPIATLQAEAQARQELERAQALSIPLRTVMRRLSYATASSIEQLLRRGILSQRGSVIVDPRTNTLIIRELPNYLDTVISVIENIDIPEPLVMIEARIVETRKNFTRTLGIEWSFSGVSGPQFGNTTGLQFPNQGTANGGVNLLTGGDNAFIDLSLGNVLNTFNLDLALQAAENEGLVNIISSPKVQALNNQQASIQSGFQIPIQTVANNTVSVQFVNATLKLDVRPQVTAEGTVLMDINIQKRNPEFGLAVAGSPNAPISTKEAQTRVLVRDGGTTVIGGIYEVSTNQGEDRVPGLANIPIIGHLFKNRRREDQNNELLIFITPRVIRF